MRVQTYAIWVHHPAPSRDAGIAGHPGDDITGFIDDLIARVAYYPSFTIQITPDADGLLVEGAQRVVQADEQPDGMVVLRTRNGNVWITHAAYHQLVA
jgi:hypothetical protein